MAIADKNHAYRLSSTDAAKEYFIHLYMDRNDKERVFVAYLDSQCRVIATKEMSNGDVNGAVMPAREIAREALFHNAVSIIVAHNHPSGNLKASPVDLESTERLTQAMKTVGVNLVDHIIVAGNHAISLANMGHIPSLGASPMGMTASPA